MKKIAINGCSGFIGSVLLDFLGKEGYEIIKIPRVTYFNPEYLFELIKDCDIVINLAGENIFGLWTSAKRKKILESRVNTTKCLVNTLDLITDKEIHLISFSAIGIYDNRGVHDEFSVRFSDSYLAYVCRCWEFEANLNKSKNINVSIVRLGIVLDFKYGFFFNLLRYKILNSIIVPDNRKGFLSFIYIGDLLKAIEFIINKHLYGVVNITSPKSVSYYSLYNNIKKFKLIRVITFVPLRILKIFLRKTVTLFESNPNVLPSVLLGNGFQFSVNNVDDFLNLPKGHI